MALVLALVLALALALDRALPPDLSRFRAVGTEVLDREGRLLSVLPAPGGVWRLRTDVRDVPPELLALLLAAEDRRFRQHPGVDPLALGRAALQWLRAGRVVSGGSTLTMQAARLLEPRPRTLRSKAIEILRALQLEARFSKDEILGLWLTLAPMGGNLEGVRAGALAWFGRPAAGLGPAEAALLVAIPRRPEALRPDRHPEAAAAARATLLRRHAPALAGPGPDEAGPVPRARLAMPRLAPHLARELAQDPVTRVQGPGSGDHAPAADAAAARIVTTLDLPLQRAAEAIAAEALRGLPERATVALLVADLRAHAVRALVGGEFGSARRAGSLDLTRAVRSPGSALKPALYALGFEAGLAGPETLLADLPRRFGGYAPENFDRGFAGRVTVADALRQSLNLPAVALLDALGPIRFAAALKAAGAPPRLPPGADPALPLALGGLGTTLREMTALYAALGDHGRAAPLRLLPGPEAAARPVFAPSAADLAAAILVQPFPGGGPAGIAWKTGTSWGGRDAWAMGMDAGHVAGVWVGRPDGTPIPGATGARLALPLLARLFERLPPAPRAGLPARPAQAAAGAALDRLRLAFPPPGAVLAAAGEPVTLRAAGGRRPLTFLVDGSPLPAEPARREAAWTPPGPGFYRVTVLDAAGEAARAELRVR
ncbi:penicillin-binding protein 1C [Roseicella frigidaeris]|uniref:peptidoglycan glycosyltransferase n=1 Tax=Roseicella frigidaeris TaxID=2230885 RepID=A0A327MAT7_9PROT|nr:penicillin-binding protein 1C [Roseicella frigidaeris]